MKVIGFSSGRTGREGNIDRLVKTILYNSSGEAEFVKLTDLTFSGCKGCVELCAKPQVCVLDDELKPYYQKIKEADAVVLGSPVYFASVNSTMQAFTERFFGYRHVTIAVNNKPFILAISGWNKNLTPVIEQFKRILSHYRVKIIGCIAYHSGVPPCYTCGRHHECRIGGMYSDMGKEALITPIRPEMFSRWENRPDICRDLEDVVTKLQALKSVL